MEEGGEEGGVVQTVVDQLWDDDEDKVTAVAVLCKNYNVSNKPNNDSAMDKGMRPSGPPNPARLWPGMESAALMHPCTQQQTAG
jgi:hypothetical protein